jgi:formylmethanofuran dehydrogenase subunit E
MTKQKKEDVNDVLDEIENDYGYEYKSEPKKTPSVPAEPIEVEKAKSVVPEVVPKPPAVHHYTIEKWKKVKSVYKCSKCGEFRDTKDEMVLHVLSHYPDKQDIILDQLLQEK